MPTERPHLLIPTTGQRYDFASRVGGGKGDRPPAVGRRDVVARRVVGEVERLIDEAAAAADAALDPLRIPVTARATIDYGVNASIPSPRKNELLSRIGRGKGARVNLAVDPASLDAFRAAAEKYVAWDGQTNRPHHFNFFEARPSLAMTTVEDLWASARPLADDEEELSLEVWLPQTGEPRLREVIEELDLDPPPRALSFETLRVLRVVAPLAAFQRLARSAVISQLRPASSLAGHIFQVPAGVQAAAVVAAARRVTAAPDDAPAVCILDTGVRSDHPLLAHSMSYSGTVVGGVESDWDGHGTKMAGLALFDDLASLINDRGSTILSTRLESVVVQAAPGTGGAADRLPAERVRRAVYRVEEEHGRLRTFCFAMNAPDDATDGGTSTLSSEIDVLASDVAGQRLFCVAAGNIEDPLVFGDYQSMNDVSGMMSPAQAWNALTVAACTDLNAVPATHSPLAPSGDLSPWSTTAVNWDRTQRPPTKPDVVYEGGNQMYDRTSRAVGPHADLALLTTSADLHHPLTLTGQTSAATAAVSGLCAAIQAEYPAFWPETVRGLVIHSAEYTAAMKARASALQGPGAFERGLLERYGFGRPDRSRAMENAEDALTLLNQSYLRPFRLNDAGKAAVLGQMRFHDMPWPLEVLAELDGVPAELRVTLSYFVAPNPGQVVRGAVREYASHGFNFDVKRPDETDEDAVARINKLLDKPRHSPPPLAWEFGNARGRGSVKHDRLSVANAADLARMAGIMVYPLQGWWGGDPELVDQQARYSLIATIRTPGQEIYAAIPGAIPV